MDKTSDRAPPSKYQYRANVAMVCLLVTKLLFTLMSRYMTGIAGDVVATGCSILFVFIRMLCSLVRVGYTSRLCATSTVHDTHGTNVRLCRISCLFPVLFAYPIHNKVVHFPSTVVFCASASMLHAPKQTIVVSCLIHKRPEFVFRAINSF